MHEGGGVSTRTTKEAGPIGEEGTEEPLKDESEVP